MINQISTHHSFQDVEGTPAGRRKQRMESAPMYNLVIIVGGTIGSVNKAKLEEVLECMNVRKGAWQAANGREAPTRLSLNSFNQTTASALKFEKSRRGQRESSYLGHAYSEMSKYVQRPGLKHMEAAEYWERRG